MENDIKKMLKDSTVTLLERDDDLKVYHVETPGSNINVELEASSEAEALKKAQSALVERSEQDDTYKVEKYTAKDVEAAKSALEQEGDES